MRPLILKKQNAFYVLAEMYDRKMSPHALDCRRIFLFFAVFYMAVGCLLYLLLRDISRMIFFGVFGSLRVIKTPLIGWHSANLFLSVLAFNIPDALWFLSGIYLIRFVWFLDNKNRNKYLFIFCFLAVFMEFLQKSDFMPGTFDLLDIASLAAAAILESIVYALFNSIRRKKIEKEKSFKTLCF